MTRLAALLLLLVTACGGENETIVIDSRGRIVALVNLEVEDVGQTLSVMGPDGDVVFVMEHTGVVTIDETEYGAEAETHLIGLGLGPELAVAWARDYGEATDIELVGGAWREPRAVLLVGRGQINDGTTAVTGPSLLPIAAADGLALPALPLERDDAVLHPLAIATRGDVTAIGGVLSRTAESDGTPLSAPRIEAWVRRYSGELGGSPTWDRGFAANEGGAEAQSVAVDSDGGVVLQGRSDGSIAELSVGPGTFFSQLGPDAGGPVWVREVNDAVAGAPMAVTADDTLVVSATALERDSTPANRALLFTLSAEDGQSLYQRTIASADTQTLTPLQLCAGADDDAHTLFGEFTGTLSAAGSTATVVNTSVFVLKNANSDGDPVYLRYSSSSVDVTAEFGDCAANGAAITGGRFQQVSTDGGTETLLYFLRLTS